MQMLVIIILDEICLKIDTADHLTSLEKVEFVGFFIALCCLFLY